MKKFDAALKDIEKMIGLEIHSIRPGAEIIIKDVNWDEKRIVITNAAGIERSRPFLEIEGLWNALCLKPAIHVDSELGGSGSSRNQPETILANLPYIEWLKYGQKKHLALIDVPSHALGTLKKMDAIIAEKIKQALQSVAESGQHHEVAQVVVVSGDITTHASIIESVSGVKARALEQGVYEYQLPSSRFLLVSADAPIGDISPGTYLIVDGSPPQQQGKLVQISGCKFISHNANGLCLLYNVKS